MSPLGSYYQENNNPFTSQNNILKQNIVFNTAKPDSLEKQLPNQTLVALESDCLAQILAPPLPSWKTQPSHITSLCLSRL